MILKVIEGREKKDILAFLQSIPKKVRRALLAVCCDLCPSFMNAAKEVFSSKQVVADRFHVAKLYRHALDRVRQKEMRILRHKLNTKDYKKLEGLQWALRKKPSQRTEQEHKAIFWAMHYSPKLKKAYQLIERLDQIFERTQTSTQAKHRFNHWMAVVKKSGLSELDTFVKTLKKHKIQISNYFTHRHSSGFVEGLNTKIKCLKRRCYGLTQVAHFFQRIYLDLQGYERFGKVKNQ